MGQFRAHQDMLMVGQFQAHQDMLMMGQFQAHQDLKIAIVPTTSAVQGILAAPQEDAVLPVATIGTPQFHNTKFNEAWDDDYVMPHMAKTTYARATFVTQASICLTDNTKGAIWWWSNLYLQRALGQEKEIRLDEA